MKKKNCFILFSALMFFFGAYLSSFAQQQSTKESFSQEKPVWKCLFLIYPNVDVNCSGTGSFTNGKRMISEAHCDSLIKKAEGFKWFVEESTQHRVEIQYDTIISYTPITKMQSTGYGDACMVVPDEDKSRLGYYTDYDVVFITANHRNSSWAGLAWGRDGSGGPLRIILVNFMGDTDGFVAFGHEFSHSYMQVQGASKHVNPHYGWADSYGDFGYSAYNQSGNPWYAIHPHAAFYHDIIAGTLQNYNDHSITLNGRTFYPHQKYLGTHPSAWRFTAKQTYPQWDLQNDFITAEYQQCSGSVLLFDQGIPMTEGMDYSFSKDEQNGIITVTGAGDYTGSITLTYDASINPEKHAVIWETSGGTAIANDSLFCDALLVEPAKPERSGYIFNGWFKEPECRNSWVFYEDRMPDGDVTVYARWVPLSGGNLINLSEATPPASGEGWTYESGMFTIIDGANVIVSGETKNKRIVVEPSATVTITLENANIDASSITVAAPITVTDANVTIYLHGKNYLQANTGADYSHAAIEQNGSGLLTFESSVVCPECDCGPCDYSNEGVLYAFGGRYAAGIGGKRGFSYGKIVINGGIIFSRGDTSRGAGIGGGRQGVGGDSIIINGGIVCPVGVNPAAALGSGDDGSNSKLAVTGVIQINGGTVYASGWSQAAISNGKTLVGGVMPDVNIGPNAVVFMTSAATPYRGAKDPNAIVRDAIGENTYLNITDYALAMELTSPDITVPAGSTLAVPPQSVITVKSGVNLINNGSVFAGKINGEIMEGGEAFGDIVNWNSQVYGTVNGITGIETMDIPSSDIQIYSDGQALKIEASAPIRQLTVTDIGGRIVYRAKSIQSVSATVSTGVLKKGVYLVSVETGNSRVTKKIIL